MASDIFVSHSSQDRAEAEGIAQWLRQEGREGYFLDFDPDQGLTAGTRWEDAALSSPSLLPCGPGRGHSELAAI